MWDFIFVDHGSLWVCAAQNDDAWTHLREHVSDEAQFWGRGVAVEPRYVYSLAEQLSADGFAVADGRFVQ